MRRFALIVLLSVSASFLGLDGREVAPPAQAAFPGGNGKIAFETSSHEIAAVNADGSGLEVLGLGFTPSWSPDGLEIAYSFGSGISVMDEHGAFIRSVTTTPDASLPEWSPDGTKISFVRSTSGQEGIWVTAADGAGTPQRLTDVAVQHRWSPDGSKILYADGDVKTIPSGGGSPINLTNTPPDDLFERMVDWSPDGQSIVFGVLDSEPFNNHIFVMSASGGPGQQLTNTPLPGAGWPAWSPDGAKIAYNDVHPAGEPFSVLRIIDAPGGVGGGDTALNISGAFPDWQPVGPPVVFLHGFLGSTINCGGGAAWPAVPPDFDAISLGADGVSPAPGACAATVGDTLDSFLGSDVYGSTIDYLKDNYGDNASLFAWDWRKSPEPSLALLDDFIDDVLARRNAEKVVLMAHSYGGLLARWYVDSPARADKVAGVVTIGTPAWGAPKALFPLYAGVETPDFSMLDAIMPNDELKEFSKNLFGNYFLYPSASYGPWLTLLPNNTPVDQQGLLNYVAALGGNPGLLSQALSRHASTLDSFPPSSVPFEVIVGAGLPTIAGVRIDPNGHVIIEYDNGDGTVPARSAARGQTGPGNPNSEHTHYACGIGHVPLPGHQAVTDAIEPFLLSGDPVDGLSDTACAASGLQFRIFNLSALPAVRAAATGGSTAVTPEEADTSGEVDYLDLPTEKFIITGETFPEMALPAAGYLEITRIGGDGAKGEALLYGPFTGQVTVLPDDGWAVVLEDGEPVDGEPAVLSGDVDCSGAVNSVDALKLSRQVAGLPVTQTQPCPVIGIGDPLVFGDVNCDGNITAVDTLFVLRFVAGMPVNLPQGCRPVGT